MIFLSHYKTLCIFRHIWNPPWWRYRKRGELQSISRKHRCLTLTVDHARCWTVSSAWFPTSHRTQFVSVIKRVLGPQRIPRTRHSIMKKVVAVRGPLCKACVIFVVCEPDLVFFLSTYVSKNPQYKILQKGVRWVPSSCGQMGRQV
jgi:hypothetical protein